MGELDVREARESDLPQLVSLLAQLSPADPAREDTSSTEAYSASFAAVAADPGYKLLVLDADGQLTGTLALIVIQNLSHRGAPFAIIENVVVDGGSRGKGYGELLIRHAVRLARDAGCYKVSLTSNKQRQDAHRFYDRLGFKRSHEAFRMDL
jgi:GNAT superfamily N-acetyltransferase